MLEAYEEESYEDLERECITATLEESRIEYRTNSMQYEPSGGEFSMVNSLHL